jgi:membrane protein
MATTKKTPFLEIITHIWDPAWLRRWATPYHQESGWRAFGVRQLEVLVLTIRSLRQEEITLRAAALTYRTLLSIVPLLAVGFALFKAFGGLQRLERPLRQLVLENLAAGQAEKVGAYLDTTIENISAGAIAGVGVLILFYSAIGLLTNIEGSFNRIFGIQRDRPFVNRFFIYWGLITLSPPFIGLSVSVSAQFQSSAFATAVVEWLPLGLGKVLVVMVSVLSTCVVFVLSYLIVPNTKVRLKAALLGGIFAGLLWNLSKYIFINVTAGSIKYNEVYGALGALPLLMIWIYLSWLIVLFGVTYTFANQSVHKEGLEVASLKVSQSYRERLAVRLVAIIARRFLEGEPPLTAEDLAERAGTMTSVVQRILEVMVSHGVLIETQGDGEETGYLPGQSLQRLSLDRVMRALREQDGASFGLADDASLSDLDRVLQEAEEASQAVLKRVDLAKL